MPSTGATDEVCERDGGRVITGWIDDDAICAFYSGSVSTALVDEARRGFWRVAGDRSVRFMMVDSLEVTRLEPSAIHIGGRFLSTFKAQGGELFVLVAKLSSVRMMLSSIMFVSGINARTVIRRKDGLELISSARAGTAENAKRR